MEHAIDFVQDKKDNVKLLKIINLVRKHKGVMTPCELVGGNGRSLTNCGRKVEEMSTLRWKKGTMSNKVQSKTSKKAWEDFVR